MQNKTVAHEAWLKRIAVAPSAAGWLGLAAAPTFALMALVTWLHGGDMPDMLCATVHDSSPLGGMVPMYMLMSAFHLTPWLRLVANCHGVVHGRRPNVRPLSRAA